MLYEVNMPRNLHNDEFSVSEVREREQKMGIIYMTPLAAKRSHFTSSGFKLRRTIRRKSLAYPSGIGSPLAYPWLVRMDTPRNSAAPA